MAPLDDSSRTEDHHQIEPAPLLSLSPVQLAEHIADVPDKRVVERPLQVMDDDGSVGSVIIEEFDTSKPVVSSMLEKFFASIVGSFLTTGAASTGRVGRALANLLPAKELVSYAVSVIERDYGREL